MRVANSHHHIIFTQTAIGTRYHPAAFSRTPLLPVRPFSRPPFLVNPPSTTASRLHTLLLATSDDNEVKPPYSPHLPYEILPFQEVTNILGRNIVGSHLENGLSYQQAEQILSAVGFNALPSRRKKSIYELWLQQFDDGLVKILVGVALASAAFSASEGWNVLLDTAQSDSSGSIIATAVAQFFFDEKIRSTVSQSFVEPAIIIAILLLNAVVGVWQDISARSSLEALEKMQPRMATVLRYDETAGTSKWITEYDARLLVPGDVIRLRVGDSIPADARLAALTSSTMYVDESSLTGESVSVGKLPADEGIEEFIKNGSNTTSGKQSTYDEMERIPIQDQSAMLFSGSLVTRGSGTALVVRTGICTELGKIQSTLFEAQSETEERKVRWTRFSYSFPFPGHRNRSKNKR